MILHTYWRSSSAYRVRIALGLKGLSYESRFVHLVHGGGENRRPEFLSKNPRGQVPVLEVEEAGQTVFLAQSIPIIEYLEERFPAPPLLPKGSILRARVRELAEIINSGIQPFHNTGTTTFLAQHAPGLDGFALGKHFVAIGLGALETRAQERAGRFLIGEEPTIADVLLVPQLYAARRLQVPLDAYPTLLRVEAECLKLEGFAAAHPDRQPDRE